MFGVSLPVLTWLLFCHLILIFKSFFPFVLGYILVNLIMLTGILVNVKLNASTELLSGGYSSLSNTFCFYSKKSQIKLKITQTQTSLHTFCGPVNPCN